MSAQNAEATGAALDATGVSVESDGHDELRAELAVLDRLTPDEQRRVDRRVEIAQEFYKIQSRVPGTAAHAAHGAQLQRLFDEATVGLDSAQRALDKAREHVEGKELAVGDAQTAYVAARDALNEFDGSAE